MLLINTIAIHAKPPVIRKHPRVPHTTQAQAHTRALANTTNSNSSTLTPASVADSSNDTTTPANTSNSNNRIPASMLKAVYNIGKLAGARCFLFVGLGRLSAALNGNGTMAYYNLLRSISSSIAIVTLIDSIMDSYSPIEKPLLLPEDTSDATKTIISILFNLVRIESIAFSTKRIASLLNHMATSNLATSELVDATRLCSIYTVTIIALSESIYKDYKNGKI